MAFRSTTCENDESKMPSVASMDAFSEVDTDYGTALSAFSCFEKEVITPVKLPAGKGVLDVYGLCFDDGSSLLEQYHSERKDTDQKWEPWRATKDGGAFRGQRQFTCTTLVKAMMNKPYTYIEYERYALFKVGDVPTLAVQFSSQVPGVMFGDAFRVEALVVFTQNGSGGNAEVTMRVFGYVQFLKSVWVKGRIMSTTMNTELPEGYKKLSDIVVAKLAGEEKGPASGGASSTAAEGAQVSAPPAAEESPMRPQTALQRDVMAYGSLGTAVLVIIVCLKSIFQTFFIARVSEVQACHPIRLNGTEHADRTCLMMVREWNEILSAVRPALIAVYLLLLTFFSGVVFKTVELSMA